MNVGTRVDRVVDVRPIMDSPVNKGHLCVKGRYGLAYVDADDRVTSPHIKKNGKWVRVSWNEAMDEAVRGLSSAIQKGGADSVGVLGSARATNEDSYLAQKFARVVLGTNNVDCCARVCHAPSAAGLSRVFGTGAATNGFDDIEQSRLFLIVGANPTENHPIVGARIRQRVLAGVPLIVVDPRQTELARIATHHLALRPGTNIALLNALAHVILQEGLVDRAFVEARVDGFKEFAEHIKEWTPEHAESICDVPANQIREAARLYARTAPAMCFHGLGVTENIQGTEGVMAIANLALLTGNLGKAGSGVNPLRGQNNVQGSAVMGCEPNKLVGSQKIEMAAEQHERVWKAILPRTPGKMVLEMMDAAGAGGIRSLLVIGYDIFLSSPDANTQEKNLRCLDSMIVVDLFMNETAREFGTVFLPAVSHLEKDGTFMNSERRIQRVRRALSPRGEALPDWQIIQMLAQKMGRTQGFDFSDPSQIWDEVRSLWPAVQGIHYDRISKQGIQWPCHDLKHPGTRVLHEHGFPIGPRASLQRLEYRPSAQQTTQEYPFILNTGRTLFHFNAATMTGRTHNSEIRAADFLDIHPEDASRLNITSGAVVRVESRYGAFEMRARISNQVRRGEFFASFHHIPAFVNRAVGPGRDPISHTPEYKVTAVRVKLDPVAVLPKRPV